MAKVKIDLRANLKGIVSRDLEVCLLVLFDRTEVAIPLMERVVFVCF
jgi:hypothetical protein